MNYKVFRTMVLAAGAAFFSLFASAQMPGGASGGVDSALIKLFGDSPTFTANASVQVLDANRVEWLRMPSSFSALNGKFRLEVDKSQIKSSKLPPGAIALDKRFGTDKVTSVTRPDARAIYIIYPNAQSYVDMPMTAADDTPASLKLLRSSIGHETINGHACVKNRSIVKNDKGVTLLDAVTWNAADLQNFPLRIETKDNNNITIMNFQQVNFARPDARLFEPPPGFQRFNSPDDLLASVMRKAETNQKK